MTGQARLRPALWLTAGLLAVGVVALAASRLGAPWKPAVTQRATPDPTCDLRAGPCTVRFAGGGAVTLELRPPGIPALTPLAVRARLDGLPQAQRVELDLVGVDMDMGFNRQPLTPDADGWQGAAMLPACVRARMTWEARVLVHLPDGLWLAPFRFDSERR